jgi:hypothetical protein
VNGTREDIERLKTHLLKFGGEGFQVDWFLNAELSEKDVAMLLSCGVLQNGRGAKLVKMTRSKCHVNAAELVTQSWFGSRSGQTPELSYFTGLALSADGIWRVHSWAVASDGMTIETTDRRTKYFGYRVRDPCEIFSQL